MVIADEAGPIALAGVMGGAETEVSASTTNILLESANFNFLNIRRTMRALDLPSEASMRFSKGVHRELVRPALERAAGSAPPYEEVEPHVRVDGRRLESALLALRHMVVEVPLHLEAPGVDEEVPSGEALAREFQRFLRQRGRN